MSEYLESADTRRFMERDKANARTFLADLPLTYHPVPGIAWPAKRKKTTGNSRRAG